jgi:hypothetical protein
MPSPTHCSVCLRMLSLRRLFSRLHRGRLDPERAFPQEVIELRDQCGVPLPNWYSGPLFDHRVSDREAHGG